MFSSKKYRNDEEGTEGTRRYPRLENFETTFKLLFENKLALIGLLITLVYGGITILDWAYPKWLGISNISNAAYFTSGGPGNLSLALPVFPYFTSGWWYWLGTTEYTIPIFPTILAALKYDITYSVLVVGCGVIIGIAIGATSAYLGGVWDEVVMRITDIFLSIPGLILIIAIAFVLGLSLLSVILALIIVWWPWYARLARSLTLTIKSSKFIEASIAGGASRLRIIFSHVLPNVLSPSLVQFSLDLGNIVLIFASFDFIGLNVSNPLLPELGMMMNWGETYFTYKYATGGIIWWPLLIPGLFLLIFTVSVNLLGDGLRDILDPRLRR